MTHAISLDEAWGDAFDSLVAPDANVDTAADNGDPTEAKSAVILSTQEHIELEADTAHELANIRIELRRLRDERKYGYSILLMLVIALAVIMHTCGSIERRLSHSARG